MQNSIYERNKKWFIIMDSIRAVASLIFLVAILFLPVKKVEFLVFKKNFSFINLWSEEVALIEGWGLTVAALGFFVMCLSMGLDYFLMKSIKEEKWKKKIKLMFYSTIAALFVFSIGQIVFSIGVEQTIIEAYGPTPVPVQAEYGEILSWIGIIAVAISMMKILFLKRVVNGEPEEKVFAIKFGNGIKKVSSQESPSESTSENFNVESKGKLQTLNELKESNLITEEEYEAKKKEVLSKF